MRRLWTRGAVIEKTEDLQYDACCVTQYDQALLEHLTEEVRSKRYGCGSPLPDAIFGLSVLDLGCGAGCDVFIAARLVGPAGRVVGVDMTGEQLAVAKRNIEPITRNPGFDRANVEFKLGEIESLDFPDDSFDCVISNCVINLSTDKSAVLKEIYRVLKPGGEFLISDIVADRRNKVTQGLEICQRERRDPLLPRRIRCSAVTSSSRRVEKNR